MQPDYRVSSMLGGCRVQLWTALCAALAAAGCGTGVPQFAPRAEVQDLMPEARQYVNEVLDQNFGTPTRSIAWERLPVRYHAATGAIATVAAGNAAELTLAPPAVAGSEEEPAPGAFEQWLPIRADVLDADGDIVEPGLEVLFVSDVMLKHIKEEQSAGRAVAPIRVQSFDEETHTLVLTAPLPVALQPGDRVILGPGDMLKQGRMLYAEHCQHCHGVSGDGNGPTARYLNPLPRDYRSAIFKFTSTQTPIRAQRGDLAHIIEDGIPGTYMPSFKLLRPEESTALVEYVLWLSCRGEAELRRYEALKNDYSEKIAREDRQAAQTSFVEAFASQFATDFDDEATQIAEIWREAHAGDAQVVPKASRTQVSAESIARGRKLFIGDKAKCSTCHGDAGQGDGSQTLAVQKDKAGKDRVEPGLFDDWNRPIRPRDLTSGIYRGGRRPVDIYRRIYAGIKGTPMTGFGTSLSEAEVWDLVNYVMSIPFEQREPGEGPFVASEDSGVGIQDSGVAQSNANSRSALDSASR